MFPGEREFTPEEVDGDLLDVVNAFAYVTEQTGLIHRSESFDSTARQGRMPNLAHFSVVPARVEPLPGYIVCRPFRAIRGVGLAALSIPDADRWWVFDSDLDEEDNAWVPQAVFTPDGFINHGPDADWNMPEGDDDDLGVLAGGPRGGPPSAPRDPNAPVRMSIDLEEHESAAAEGIPSWEDHDGWAVLSNPNGIAVVYEAGPVGIVRYPDKTACTIKAGTPSEAREMAEKFLANRPYKTAMERVLDDGTFDDEDAPPPAAFAPTEAPTRPTIPRPQAEKRVWRTVPIESAEEDD